MNLDDLDPDSPEYEAALQAAQAEEDAANGNEETADQNANANAAGGDDDTDPEAIAPATEPTAETAPASPEKPSSPSGVMSKDGKTVLPFAVVQSARQDRARERDGRIAAEAEAGRLRQELEDLRAGRVPAAEATDPIDEALAEAIEEIPALAAVAKALKETREELAALKGKPAQAAKEEVDAGTDDDPVQSAIDAVPMLAVWQATDPEKFRRAQQLDVAISGSRKWADKPIGERFAHVVKLVADEFDIQVEDEIAPQRTNTPNRANPKDVISRAARAAPNTLSDMKGGAAATTEDRMDRMPAQKMLSRMQDMTDDEIDAHLAKFG